MASRGGILLRKETTSGDSAVSGLLNGLLGGGAMAIVTAAASLLAGRGLAYLTYFSADKPVPPLQGLMVHLAVAGTYGMLYGLLRRWLGLERSRFPRAISGLIYGMGLWALAAGLLLPSAHSPLQSIPWPAFLAAHLVYGWVLGSRQAP